MDVTKERKEVIKALSELAEVCPGQEIRITREDIKAFKFAINSLRTDLKYSLDYDRIKYYTADEVVSILQRIKENISKFEDCNITHVYLEGSPVEKSTREIEKEIVAIKAEDKDV